MELEELKTIWKEVNDNDSNGYWVSKTNLQNMITKKSQSVVSGIIRKLKYKVRAGLTIGVLALLLGIVFFVRGENEPSIYEFMTQREAGGILAFMSYFILVVAWYNRIRYKELMALELSSASIKHSINETLENVYRVMKTSVLSDAIGAPIITFWMLYIKFYGNNNFEIDKRLWIVIIVFLASIPFFYYLAYFLQKEKYNHHIKRLINYSEQLESNEL